MESSTSRSFDVAADKETVWNVVTSPAFWDAGRVVSASTDLGHAGALMRTRWFGLRTLTTQQATHSELLKLRFAWDRNVRVTALEFTDCGPTGTSVTVRLTERTNPWGLVVWSCVAAVIAVQFTVVLPAGYRPLWWLMLVPALTVTWTASLTLGVLWCHCRVGLFLQAMGIQFKLKADLQARDQMPSAAGTDSGCRHGAS